MQREVKIINIVVNDLMVNVLNLKVPAIYVRELFRLLFYFSLDTNNADAGERDFNSVVQSRHSFVDVWCKIIDVLAGSVH